jgi:alpha/beta superfamily hydrolase
MGLATALSTSLSVRARLSSSTKNTDRLTDIALKLVKEGFAVTACDHEGHGKSDGVLPSDIG